MLTYIKTWLIFSKVSETDSQLILQKLTAPQTIINAYQTELYSYIESAVDYKNFLTFPELFNAIKRCVKLIFNWPTNHHQRHDLRDLKNAYKKNLSQEFIEMLWTIELFTFLCSKSSAYLLDSPAEKTTEDQKLFTMIELVEGVASELLHKHLLLYIIGEVDENLNNDLVVKKYVHIVLHELGLLEQNYFSIHLKKLQDLVTVSDFLKTKIDSTHSFGKKNYLKLTLVIVSLPFHENYLKRFSILLSPPTILDRDGHYVVVARFYLICQNFITQRHNKEPTVITKALVEKIKALTNTAFFPDYPLIGQVSELVKLEFKSLQDELVEVYSKINETDKLKLHIPEGTLVLGAISQLINKQKGFSFRRNAVERSMLKVSQDTAPTPGKRMREVLTLHGDFNGYIQKWYKVVGLCKEIDNFLPRLQKIFSRLGLLKNYFTYVEFLYENQLDSCYFPGFIDFRGRFYYNSIVSVQTYWCFRYLYHFGEGVQGTEPNYLLNEETYLIYDKYCKDAGLNNPDYFEFYQSIGFLFKKTLTNNQGEINLNSIIELGVQTYLKYRNLSILELIRNLGGEFKLAMELYYYIHAINQAVLGSRSLYYIWKDTTCSMAQHAGKLLGYNENQLHLLNLANTNIAIDTYQIYINQLKKLLQTKHPDLWSATKMKLLNRSSLKNLIMTTEYGVSFFTAKSEFAQTLSGLELTDEEYSTIADKKYFKSIFEVLADETLDLYFYRTTKGSWVDQQLEKPANTFELEDIKIPTDYYHKNTHTIYYEDKSSKDRRIRHTLAVKFVVQINYQVYLRELGKQDTATQIDKRKTKAAIYVNAIHACDAAYLREIALACKQKNIPLATIHDGFAVPYTHGSWILSAAAGCFFFNLNTDDFFYKKIKANPPVIQSTTIII